MAARRGVRSVDRVNADEHRTEISGLSNRVPVVNADDVCAGFKWRGVSDKCHGDLIRHYSSWHGGWLAYCEYHYDAWHRYNWGLRVVRVTDEHGEPLDPNDAIVDFLKNGSRN